MISRALGFMLYLLLVFNISAFAQDDDIHATVDYKVNKMKAELKLTEAQSVAVTPIIKEYLLKHAAFLQEGVGQGIVDHVSVRGTLKALKENEYQKLSKILTADQMKKWINKENLMATLNPDSMESSVDEGTSLNPSGANFRF